MLQIWLKDAFQCRGCAMTCHKKCVSKCLSLSSCGRRASAQPEIVTTVVDEAAKETKPEQVVTHTLNHTYPLVLCNVKILR